MKSEIPLQSQQSCPLTLTFVASLLKPALWRPSWSAAKSTIQSESKYILKITPKKKKCYLTAVTQHIHANYHRVGVFLSLALRERSFFFFFFPAWKHLTSCSQWNSARERERLPLSRTTDCHWERLIQMIAWNHVGSISRRQAKATTSTEAARASVQ